MIPTMHSLPPPSGALPAGTRAEKVNSKRGDSHPNGAPGNPPPRPQGISRAVPSGAARSFFKISEKAGIIAP